MMSTHSHHPQPRRLAAVAAAVIADEASPPSNTTVYESSSSSSTNSKSFDPKYSNSTTTTSTTLNSNTTCFKSKQHQHQNQTIPSCFNVCFGKSWFNSCSKFIFKRSTTSSSFSLFMASEADTLVHVPTAIRSSRDKKISAQQKRQELEREVSMLHKMLDHEEMVHDILEHVIHRPEGSPLHIPGFLPPQMKELLTELATVEDEIARLEGEVRNLQSGLNHEQEIAKEFKQWQHGNQMRNPNYNFSMPPQSSKPTTTTKWVNERMPFESKAMHFISKAIKGDYKTSDFTRKERVGNLASTTDQKENYASEELGLFQEKVSRKSGILKPTSSPLRPPRHPTFKPFDLDKDISFDLPPKSLPKFSSSPLKEISTQKSQPNKLSESIMKCLIFIFVRLMRTSRALELEKLSTVSRPTHSSFNLSKSFRTEAKTTSLSPQKDSRQQDPYGIFDIDDSIPRDIGPYKNLVRFTSSSLDPKSISSSSSTPLLQKLRVLMKNLENVDLRFLTHQQKLAFWINMYNACIMHGFLHYGVPSSPEKLLGLMNKATVTIGDNKINAQAIEHFILRQPSSSSLKEGEEYEKEAAAYDIYGIRSPEPNITFALCCGTRSSPSVRIYTADGVLAELERSKLEYLQASIAVTSTKRLVIPELLLRNMLDFASDTDSLVEWVCHQLPTSGSLRKLMVDCLFQPNLQELDSKYQQSPFSLLPHELLKTPQYFQVLQTNPIDPLLSVSYHTHHSELPPLLSRRIREKLS